MWAHFVCFISIGNHINSVDNVFLNKQIKPTVTIRVLFSEPYFFQWNKLGSEKRLVTQKIVDIDRLLRGKRFKNVQIWIQEVCDFLRRVC